MSAREILIYLSVKHEGDWNKIYEALSNKESGSEQEIIEVNKSVKSKVLTIIDPDYPDYLKNVFKPPIVLFYYGDISLIKDYKKNVSFIGSRKYSEYGREMTEQLVSTVSEEFNIVSGMAVGIDTIAHKAAINKGNKTVAVLGSGIDFCWPPSNESLYNQLKEKHLVISEYPGNLSPKQEFFPLRNRLVAAFSRACVITEAYERSGTSITANYALAYGRDVFCVPYLANKNSLCNRLIAQGAALVETGEQVLDELGISKVKEEFAL